MCNNNITSGLLFSIIVAALSKVQLDSAITVGLSTILKNQSNPSSLVVVYPSFTTVSSLYYHIAVFLSKIYRYIHFSDNHCTANFTDFCGALTRQSNQTCQSPTNKFVLFLWFQGSFQQSAALHRLCLFQASATGRASVQRIICICVEIFVS